MALKIRLSRAGAKKRPYYRIVLADSRSPRDGRYIERLGSYDPMLPKNSDDRVKIDEERVKHWLSKGAKPTDRVARFLANAKIIDTPQIPEQTKKSQPKQKTLDRIAEREEKAKAAAEAAEAEREEKAKAAAEAAEAEREEKAKAAAEAAETQENTDQAQDDDIESIDSKINSDSSDSETKEPASDAADDESDTKTDNKSD
jgi:small subunit ribosomal protein S16